MRSPEIGQPSLFSLISKIKKLLFHTEKCQRIRVAVFIYSLLCSRFPVSCKSVKKISHVKHICILAKAVNTLLNVTNASPWNASTDLNINMSHFHSQPLPSTVLLTCDLSVFSFSQVMVWSLRQYYTWFNRSAIVHTRYLQPLSPPSPPSPLPPSPAPASGWLSKCNRFYVLN